MFKSQSLLTTTRRAGATMSLLLVGASLFAACTMPATKPATGTASTASKPAVSQPAAKPTESQTAAKPATSEAATIMLHKDAKLGSFLVDDKGMALYIFAKDSAGKSTCAGDCAKNWMPFTAKDQNAKLSDGQGITGKLSLIKRDDGAYQIAYDNLPLYHYVQDKQPGEMHGQGMDNNWWLLAPDGKQITTKAS